MRKALAFFLNFKYQPFLFTIKFYKSINKYSYSLLLRT
jgi:hypothetical protein